MRLVIVKKDEVGYLSLNRLEEMNVLDRKITHKIWQI